MDIITPRRKSALEIGKIYFWTAIIRKWKPLLLADGFKQIIIDSLIFLTDRNLVKVFGFVIMPNHIHLLWRIEKVNGKELPNASLLKYTAHEFKKRLDGNQLSEYYVDASNKEFEFWKRDSLGIELYSPDVGYQKLDYIHNNPLSGKWNLALEPMEY